ncbi:hypothetical protein ACGVWS_09960 [Enterobacteriaceae bacterium LUAb1]
MNKKQNNSPKVLLDDALFAIVVLAAVSVALIVFIFLIGWYTT